MASSHLLILGEREAIAWVLANERMAFTAHRVRALAAVQVGDDLLVYTTRGAFHNPTRDRGRVVGRALVATDVRRLAGPVTIAGREFTHGCGLRVLELAPLGSGVELAPLIPELSSFPNKRGWAMRLRRPPAHADRRGCAAASGSPRERLAATR